MNNSKFSDLMSTVNETAQAMGFTNGIAWARNALENKKLTKLEFNSFEKCHFLRNMIAHGSAGDIQISEETLNIAKAFCAAISAQSAEVSQPEAAAAAEAPKPEQKKQYSPQKTPIRVGDYVIMFRNHKLYRSNFSATADENDQQQFTPGFVYRVEDKELNLYALTAPKGGYTERRWIAEHSNLIYIFRTDTDLDIPGKKLYVIEKPKRSKQDGKHYITFQYVQYDPQEKEQQVQEMTCEGYLADPYTFTAITPKVSDRGDETANIKDGEEITILPKRNFSLHGHIRMDDYLIIMQKDEYYWGTFNRMPDPNAQEQKTFQPGLVGQITDPKLQKFYMLTYNYDTEYKHWISGSDALYIFRTDRIMDYGLTPYILDKPIEFEKDGKPYLEIRYVQHDERCPMWTEEIDLVCEGYRVDPNTFEWLNKVYDAEGKHPIV